MPLYARRMLEGLSAQDLATWGLLGVFIAGFLAGSVFAFPSEVVLAAGVAARMAPVAIVVAVATAGNVAGAVTVFAIGRFAARASEGRLKAWFERRAGRERVHQKLPALQRWGAPVLLFSWVPFVGDALVLAAGALRVRWLPFLVFTTVGKAARYAAVAWSAAALLN
ncbi:MAG: VTT domain-containing protein [Myxococcaceae bacterium]